MAGEESKTLALVLLERPLSVRMTFGASRDRRKEGFINGFSLTLSLSFQDLDVGARNVAVYVDGDLVFGGELPKGCGMTDPKGSTTINLQNTSLLPPEDQEGRPWTQQPAGGLFSLKSAAEENHSEETVPPVSLAQVGGCPPVPSDSASMEHVQSSSAPEVPELVHSDDELSLSEQMDKLCSRKTTPVLPSLSAKNEPCSGAGQLPFKPPPEPPLDLRARLPPESRRRVSLEATGDSPRLPRAEPERGCSEATGTDLKLPALFTGESTADLDFLNLLSRKYSRTSEHVPPGRQRGKEDSSNDWGEEETPWDRGKKVHTMQFADIAAKNGPLQKVPLHANVATEFLPKAGDRDCSSPEPKDLRRLPASSHRIQSAGSSP